MKLSPFLLTASHQLPHLHHLDAFADELHVFLVHEPATRPFAQLLNHTNQLAFGGDTNMGMPLWVMLDCGILSSAIVGFGAPRHTLDPDTLARLGVPADYPDHLLVPLSEYCACPTVKPGCVSGFSLQSQLPGHALGLRTKALAMLFYGASSQVGVTQFDNPAIRVHARFGPMKILVHRPVIHTHAHKSFVYELDLPTATTLEAMARDPHHAIAPPPPPSSHDWSFDPDDETHHQRLAALLDRGEEVFITQPGWEKDLSDQTIRIPMKSILT